MFPFQRSKTDTKEEFDKRFRVEIIRTLKLLSENMSKFQPCVDAEIDLSDNLIQLASDIFCQRWILNDNMSEIAFRGLLVILEYCLTYELANLESFAYFLDALSDHDALFWTKTVPLLFESDMEYGTSYRDAVLFRLSETMVCNCIHVFNTHFCFSLTLNDVNNGKSRLIRFFGAVPGLRDSMLARNAKRFEEVYHTLIRRRFPTPTPESAVSSDSSDEEDTKEFDKTQTTITTETDKDNTDKDIRRMECFEDEYGKVAKSPIPLINKNEENISSSPTNRPHSPSTN